MSTLSNLASTPAAGSRLWTALRQETVAPARAAADESLVADARAGLSPSQLVERKLLTLLDGRPLPAALSPVAGRAFLRRS